MSDEPMPESYRVRPLLTTRHQVECCRRVGRDEVARLTTIGLPELDALCDTALVGIAIRDACCKLIDFMSGKHVPGMELELVDTADKAILAAIALLKHYEEVKNRLASANIDGLTAIQKMVNALDVAYAAAEQFKAEAKTCFGGRPRPSPAETQPRAFTLSTRWGCPTHGGGGEDLDFSGHCGVCGGELTEFCINCGGKAAAHNRDCGAPF